MHRLSKLAVSVAVAATFIAGTAVADGEVAAEAATGDPGYQWSSVEIGGGGFVTGLVVGPKGEVYSRTDVGGAYRWNESSGSWEQMLTVAGVPNPVSGDYEVESIAVSPSNGNVVYAAVGSTLRRAEGRVLRSSDGGRTWRDGGQRFVVHGNEKWKWTGERLSVDPANPDVVLYGTRTEGLWRSVDGGNTWAKTTAAYPPYSGIGSPAGVMFTTFDPKSRVVGGRSQTAWAGVSDVGLLRTDDGGATWRVVYDTPGGVPRDAEFSNDGRLYVVVHASTSLVLRVDTATSAVEVVGPTARGKLATIAVDPSQPGRLILAESGVKNGALWRSTDGGTTWKWLKISLATNGPTWPLQTDIQGWMSVGEMTFDPSRPGTLWFAEGMGVWRTTDLADDNVTWQFESKGIEELVSTDAVKPSGQALLTSHWDRNVFRHGGGATGAEPVLTSRFNAAWDLDVADHDPSFVAAVVDDNRFIGGETGAQSGYSTDGGKTWQRFASLVNGTHPSGLKFGNIAVSTGNVDNLVWAPSRGGKVHWSTDRGATWRLATYPGTEHHSNFYLNRRVLTADAVKGGTFYLLDVKGIMRSTDGGATWTKTLGTGLPPSWGRRYNATLAAVPGRAGELVLSTGELNDGAFGLLHSTDGGETWSKLPGIDDVGTFGFGAPATKGGPPVLFATANAPSRGVWRSDDFGASWKLLSAAPLGIYNNIRVVSGDPDVAGKVYVGFSGVGFATGTPTGASTPTTTVPKPTTTVPAPTTTAPAPTKSRPAKGRGAAKKGFFTVSAGGSVKGHGDATARGSVKKASLAEPIVALSPTPTNEGYWLAASDGGVFTFGDAPFHGSTGATPLNKPIVGIAATETGDGYWMVATDGGVFSFGDARFFGSTGAIKLNKAIVGMTGTVAGDGYWLVASDGGVFSFGDARFFGSTGGLALRSPVVSITATPSGEGYWMLAADGGVFSFGDAAFHGSAAGGGFRATKMASTPSGNGYWIVGEAGEVRAFGDAG